MLEKSELRKRIRAALLECSQGMLREASDSIRTAVLESPAWEGAKVIGLYAAGPLEPFIDPLLEAAIEAGKRVVFPRVTSHGLALIEVNTGKDLQETPRWKLREPVGEHLREVEPHEVGLLLVPGLAFDRAGYRLGRGGGYYDRLLGNVPRAVCHGICFDLQLVPEVPVESHDEPMGTIVTELGALKC